MLRTLLGGLLQRRKPLLRLRATATTAAPNFVPRLYNSKTMEEASKEEKESPEVSSSSKTKAETTTTADKKNENNTTTTTTATMIDNPCWGSPTACSLKDLLQTIQQSTAILHESDDYLALDKPPDLRMDGPYPATVHKLLTFWYPPPSLRAAADEDKDSLLQKVAQHHLHSDHADNELRPCHQLDYATSGVLLVARSKRAASHARTCFEQRTARKAYVAVVEGHVVNDAQQWPVLTEHQVQERLAALEDRFRRSRRKRRPETFQGYQPPHALYQQWQQQAMLDNDDERSKKKSKRSKLSDDEWQRVWTTLNANACDPPLDPHKDWGHVKKRKQTARFQQAANVYNEIILLQQQQEEASNNGNDDNALPVFFRVENQNDCFYIAAPLAEVKDEFAMRVPPNVVSSSLPCPVLLQAGPADAIYRPALTQFKVLQLGWLSDDNNNNGDNLQPVTKVRLTPHTGRRHQLRVHCALAGHAIVGDQTYNNSATTETTTTRRRRNRMCLHSCMLQIPLPNDGKKDDNEDDKILRIEAPDPFVLDKVVEANDGEMQHRHHDGI